MSPRHLPPAAIAASVPVVAFGHPGHAAPGNPPDGWLHFVTSPDHLPAIVVLALVGVVAALAAVRRTVRGRRDRGSR